MRVCRFLVRLFDRLALWEAQRREFNHERWLRKNGVIHTSPRRPKELCSPHVSARRNGTQAVTR